MLKYLEILSGEPRQPHEQVGARDAARDAAEHAAEPAAARRQRLHVLDGQLREAGEVGERLLLEGRRAAEQLRQRRRQVRDLLRDGGAVGQRADEREGAADGRQPRRQAADGGQAAGAEAGEVRHARDQRLHEAEYRLRQGGDDGRADGAAGQQALRRWREEGHRRRQALQEGTEGKDVVELEPVVGHGQRQAGGVGLQGEVAKLYRWRHGGKVS